MPRNLRVSICGYGLCKTPGCTPPPFDLRRNVAEALDLVRQAAAEGADLAVLPEIFAVQHSGDMTAHAEPLDGYVVTTLAGEARRLGVGIAAGQPTLEDGKRYNSIVLLGRRGEVAAVYHKAFPTIWELERGIVPGPGAVVAETEFGRLGFAICYDLNFRELRAAYADRRPDLVLFCSAFRGGLQTRWWGFETRSYVVSSCLDPRSVVVNPLGRVVAQTDSWTRTLTRTLNLDYAVVHYDYSNRSLAAVRARHGRDFDFEWAEPEGVMLVSATGKMTTAELLREAGWEHVEDYFARARSSRDAALAGRPVPMGPPPW